MKKCLFIILINLFIVSSTLFSQEIVYEGLKEINGTQLYIKIIGKGEPLFIIHGGPGLNHNYFLPHLESLAKKYQLIFFDQRSSGQSYLNVKANMNFKTFADDIEAIRKEFNYDKINILCHSWGALPATTYLLGYTANVNSIIYCNPIPMNKAFSIQASQNAIEKTLSSDSLKRVELMASPGFQKGEMLIVNQLMMLSFKQLFCDTNKLQLLDPKLPENYLVAALSLAGLMQDMKSFDFYPKLKDINIPVLIIHGNCDITPQEADQKLQQSFPNATLVNFEHSGHFPFIEENKLFIKTICKFMRSVD